MKVVSSTVHDLRGTSNEVLMPALPKTFLGEVDLVAVSSMEIMSNKVLYVYESTMYFTGTAIQYNVIPTNNIKTIKTA